MEILFAILFYLNMLMPGVSYTAVELNAKVQANQPIIMQVQSNPMLMNQAMTTAAATVVKRLLKILDQASSFINKRCFVQFSQFCK